MSHKSQIRQAIETILGQSFRKVFIDATNPRNPQSTTYRLKFYGSAPATPEQLAQIMALPHVKRVGYTRPAAECEGVIVFTNKRPDRIKIS